MTKAIFGGKAGWGLVMGLSLACSAQASVWTYTGVNSGAGVDVASAGAASLTTIGVYATNNGSSGLTGPWSSGTPAAALGFDVDGGLGMASDGSTRPNHAIDNSGTNTEGVLLSFSVSTMLTGLDLGHVSGDADLSIFRYVGALPPTLSGVGASLAAMNTAGWQLVGNYANLSQDNAAPYAYNLINGATDADPTSGVTPTANGGSLGSSWWLITAYNTAFGGGRNLTQGDDYFQLLSVTGDTCTDLTPRCGAQPTMEVPEPTSLALVGLALCGLLNTRRHRGARKAG